MVKQGSCKPQTAESVSASGSKGNMELQKEYVDFWKARTFEEAWPLIVTAEQENEADTHRDVNLVLDGRQYYTDGVALEIGCGVGRLMRPLSLYYTKIIGLDISTGMVDLSKDYLGSSACDNCVTKWYDGITFPVFSNSVDFVYSYITFQHIPTRELVQNTLKEAYRVMRPTATIRVQTIHGEPCGPFEGMHGCYFKNAREFAEEFFKAGFQVTKTQVGLGHPSSIWVTAIKS